MFFWGENCQPSSAAFGERAGQRWDILFSWDGSVLAVLELPRYASPADETLDASPSHSSFPVLFNRVKELDLFFCTTAHMPAYYCQIYLDRLFQCRSIYLTFR